MEDYKYGLMVLDPELEDEHGNVGVVHVCLYQTEPTQDDMLDLYNELKTDEEFGLTDIIDRLEIAHAPQHLVDSVIENMG